MNTPAPRVLVSTQRAAVRTQLCALLAADGVAVLGEEAAIDLEMVRRVFAPRVAVLDLVPAGCGPLLWRLDPHRNTLALLLPTTAAGGADVAAAWRSGAADIAPDPDDVSDIHRRITTLLGRTELHGRSGRPGARVGDIVIDEAGHVAHRGDVELQLTLTEFRLLVAFVTNAGIVMSKRQLLSGVWGFDDYHVNLVEVHVSALRRKLEAHGPRIIHTVRGIGYVLRHSWDGAVRPYRIDAQPG